MQPGRERTVKLLQTPAFDEHNPPADNLLADCVHCGFCLPSCPTYLLWGEEMDSPRGRIYLMKEGLEGQPLTDSMARHFDLCLGCMACVTACPSGVRYNKLIESTRQQVERRYTRNFVDRLYRRSIFELFPHPERLRRLIPLLWAYQRSGIPGILRHSGVLSKLPSHLVSAHDIMPAVHGPISSMRVRELTPACGERRARVAMLTGCVQSVFFGEVNAATVRVLAAEGCEVFAPRQQPCCGALGVHAGREEDAKRYARKLIDVFERYAPDLIAVNAAGCGSSMKEYGDLLADDPEYAGKAESFAARVRDVSELLVELGPRAVRHRIDASVAYHDACHLAHAQGIRQQPRQLLASIPGVKLVTIAESEICCGSAGIYNLVEPKPAAELGERKARNIIATNADVVVSSNPGCTLQIKAAASKLQNEIKVLHPMEILDISLRGVKL